MDTGTESRNCMQSSVWAMLYIEGVHQKLDQLLCEQLADFCLFSYPPEYAELGVAYPASRILSPAAKRFIKYLKVYVSEA